MIDGYLGQVLPDQLLGWSFDRDDPNAHLIVDIFYGARHLGSTVANIYRADLAAGGIGEGDHAFLFRYPFDLEGCEPGAIVVRVRTGADPAAGQQLARWTFEKPRDTTGRVFRDDTQFPVFVLGAARSGTSAVAQALRAATRYQGNNEGQILDLLTPLLREVRRFYASKADDVSMPERNTTIFKVPEAYFNDGICALCASLTRQLFPESYWFDKTPTANMIWAAPDLLRIWPQAKFIFMKRRALENLSSRLRKFADVPFEVHCREWTGSMEAWRVVRSELAGRAIEVDQYVLARDPGRVATAIGALLNLAVEDTAKLAQVLTKNRPEHTGADILDVCDAGTLGWGAENWTDFDRLCGPSMQYFGYSRDQHYFAAGRPDQSCFAF